MNPKSEISPPDHKPKCVVAIGGSAGALDAFGRFIKAIPADVNAAVVVLQHMDPAQKSLLPELLQHMSAFPVAIATNGTQLQPRHIYVIEPGTTLGLQGTKFAARWAKASASSLNSPCIADR